MGKTIHTESPSVGQPTMSACELETAQITAIPSKALHLPTVPLPLVLALQPQPQIRQCSRQGCSCSTSKDRQGTQRARPHSSHAIPKNHRSRVLTTNCSVALGCRCSLQACQPQTAEKFTAQTTAIHPLRSQGTATADGSATSGAGCTASVCTAASRALQHTSFDVIPTNTLHSTNEPVQCFAACACNIMTNPPKHENAETP